jgi:serine/threonine-protein kinase
MNTDRTLVVAAEKARGNDPGMASADGVPPAKNSMPTAVGQRFQTIRAATTRVSSEQMNSDPEVLRALVAVDRRYQVLGKFAEGGQGEINTAKDRILDRFVAIKSLKAEHVGNEGIVAGFIAEAKVTAQLDHPAIVPLYDLNGGPDQRLHMAMKLIFGQTLRELIDDAVLDCRHRKAARGADEELRALKARLEHFIKVCDAVSFAHDKKVVHRDLKPENVMIGQFHEVYVMDWGIAEVMPESSCPTIPPSGEGISGTPGYIAPEVISDRPASAASDQYALGMILFELAALKPGLCGGGMAEVFNRTVRGEHEALTHLLPHCRIPGDLRAIIRKTLAMKPEERYPSVAALANDVRRFLQDDETAARPDNPPRRLLRWLARHRVLAAGLVLGVLAAFAGVTVASVVRHQQSVIALRQRQLLHVHLQSEAARRAHRIDRHLLNTAAVLERFSDELLFLLSGRGGAAKDTAIADTETFRHPENEPAGTQFSPYYQQRINLVTANCSLAPGVDAAAVANKIRDLAPMVGDLLPLMAAADPDYTPRPPEVLAQRVLSTGLPVAWMYVGLAEGVLIGYPGSGTLPKDYDPRQRPWYSNAEHAPGVVWSAPYIDASGLDLVMSASRSLRDRNGGLLGVASLDMTFAAILALLSADTHELPVLHRYLVDQEARVMVQSDVKSERLEEARKDLAELRFDPFPYPQLATHLRRQEGGQFEVGTGRGRRLIAYAPVSSMGWYLVEEIDLPAFIAQAAAREQK